MSRFHRVVTEVEGRCLLCGQCCQGCANLSREGGKWICTEHDSRPEWCKRFPLDYAVELVPSKCGFRVTGTRRVDETEEGTRIRVSGRTSLSVLTGLETGDGEVFPDVYDVQHRVVTAGGSRVYRDEPRRLARRLAKLAGRIAQVEGEHGSSRPLADNGWFRTEKLCRKAMEALLVYAESRDIVMGDFFPSEEEASD